MTGGAAPEMRLLNFRPSAQGSRLGFAAIELPIGLKITGISLHRAPDERFFALLPSAADLDQDGVQKRDAYGNRMWRPIVEWTSSSGQRDWSARLVALVRERFPDVFGPQWSRR